MAPDGERTYRKTLVTHSSTSAYSDANNIDTHKPGNKALEPKQSRHEVSSSSMAIDGKSQSSSSSTNMTPVYSLATTKAVKPTNKTGAPRQALRINLQQRQRHQQQLQQIRAIRRKRTVAFAVNHEERVSQPHAACVVSADAAPGRDNSSSAHALPTDSTFPSRASPSVPHSVCTFQKKEENSNREKEFLRTTYAFVGSQNPSIATERNQKPRSRLVVDVHCAEEAAAASSIKIIQGTSTGGEISRPAPVPVTPTYLTTNSNDIAAAVVETKLMEGTEERPLKKQKASPNQERGENEVSSQNPAPPELNSRLSKKSKIKRVRYDMECVPLVEINQVIWKDFSGRLRKETLVHKSSLSRRSLCDNKIDDNTKNLVQQNSLLQRSVLWIPSSREEWEDCISEMKGICTSAAFRRWSKIIMNQYQKNMSTIQYNNNGKIDQVATPQHNMKPFHPPLSQAFIKDRVRIDDPLRGYQIRHATGGWLQGFLVWTNFTVWTLDFQWNSNHPASGLLNLKGTAEAPTCSQDDGTLSKELQALPRGEQDPLDGGTVLKQIAEISLLGGLGCGELLLRKAIEDIRNSKSSDNLGYKYVVLQATEGSKAFYEKMGFVRVGAVCRYRWAEYCTSGKSPGKKLDIAKVESMEVDSKFHGYRHWTYTNESSKSLNAHGGPSVMMCLKLDDYGEENRQSISELLQPHIVKGKPSIQAFGNVSNPDSENLVPTRKSQRRSSGTRSFEVLEKEERGEKDKCETSLTKGSQLGEVIPDATRRRTSNRSKRGKNASLANSCYVLYGVEGGRNTCNTSDMTNQISKKSKRKR